MFNTLKFVIKILSNTALAHRSARAGDSNTSSISIKAVAEPGLYLQSDLGVSPQACQCLGQMQLIAHLISTKLPLLNKTNP